MGTTGISFNDCTMKLGKDQFQCSICSAIFDRKVHLNKHIKGVHRRSNNHNCDECEYSTSSKTDLKRHVKRHKSTQLFKCEQCSYSTERKSYFIRHIDIMHKNMATQNVGPGKCDQLPIEGHIAKSLSALQDNIHTGKQEIVELLTSVKKVARKIKSYQCPQCRDCFSSKRAIKQHEKEAHPNTQCGKCELSCQNKVELKRHVRLVHKNKMNFKCKKCSYITERKSYLVRHIEIMH